MAAQTKKKTAEKKTAAKKKEKAPMNPNVFKWTPQRKKAAFMLSEGIHQYKDIANEVRVNPWTLWEWRKHPIFIKEVSRLTFENEKATREGLLRLAFKAIEEKMGRLQEDKTTLLDWVKFISDLQGMAKQKIEFDNVTESRTPRTQEVIDAEYELLKAITKAEQENKNDGGGN